MTAIPFFVMAEDGADSATHEAGKRLFESYCGVCHSLALPRSQHLDRANWEWVMDDMVENFGATWITSDQQKQIIDYLVAEHGRKD